MIILSEWDNYDGYPYSSWVTIMIILSACGNYYAHP